MSIAPRPSAQASVQQPTMPVNLISRQRVAKIVLQLKDTYGWTGPEFNAVCKASFELEAATWQWDAATKTLIVASRTARNKRYRVTEHTCCDAKSGEFCRQSGQVHWHAAAWEVLNRASQPERVIIPQTDEEFAKTLELVDDLY